MANEPEWVKDLLGSSATTYRAPEQRASSSSSPSPHWGLAQAAAQRHGLDPSLLAGVWDFESSNNPGAINKNSGATGLGQVMPREAGFRDRPTQQELLNPETNAEWSARILKSGLDRYGSEDKALAAYLGAIDARGNITGAVDANGTGGNQYIRTVRERQQKYRQGTDDLVDRGPGVANPAAAGIASMQAAEAAGAPDWVRDLLGNSVAGRNGQDLISTSNTNPEAPDWVRDLQASPPSLSGAGRSTPASPGYAGQPQTDEIWPVAGQRWGQVNNPFGGQQARSAGATVALPSSNVGADLTARYGAQVVAPVSGTVVEVFDAPNENDRNANHGWGGMTLLRGDNGYFYRMSHAQPGSVAAQPGQRVAQGQPLQRVGVSGNTTGAHLDYEKFDRPGHFVDPVAGAAGGSGTVASPNEGWGSAGGMVTDRSPTMPDWVRDLMGGR